MTAKQRLQEAVKVACANHADVEAAIHDVYDRVDRDDLEELAMDLVRAAVRARLHAQRSWTRRETIAYATRPVAPAEFAIATAAAALRFLDWPIGNKRLAQADAGDLAEAAKSHATQSGAHAARARFFAMLAGGLGVGEVVGDKYSESGLQDAWRLASGVAPGAIAATA